MHVKYRYACYYWTWIDAWGWIFLQKSLLPSTQSNWSAATDRGGFSVSYSQAEMNCDKPWIPPLAAGPEFLVYRLRRSLFMETPTEDLSQESVSRRTQSHQCGRVLTLLLGFRGPNLAAPSPRSSTLCYIQFTPTAVKSTLSCYHVSYMECVMKGTEAETALTGKR